MTKHPDALRQQIEALQERISRLCGALLRISGSLDLDTVLQEVVDSARAYRDEQRARASLEALVDTSPVGVVVFDARTGDAVSLNREAKRIVGGLMMPDRSGNVCSAAAPAGSP